MWSQHKFHAFESEAIRRQGRGLMQTKDRIQHVRERVKRLRRMSQQLMQHSKELHRQSARLRAFTPVAAEHLVKLRLNDGIALTGTLAESSGVIDRDMSASIAD